MHAQCSFPEVLFNIHFFLSPIFPILQPRTVLLAQGNISEGLTHGITQESYNQILSSP